MNIFIKYLILLVAIFATSTVYATSWPPKPKPNVPDTLIKNHNQNYNKTHADATAKAKANNTNHITNDSNSTATGGHATANGGNGVGVGIAKGGAGGDSSNKLRLDTTLRNIDNSSTALTAGSLTGGNVTTGGTSLSLGGDSTDIDTIFVPTHTVPVPPSTIPNTQSIQTITNCGPRQHITTDPVTGKYHGFFSTSDVELGKTNGLTSQDEPFKTTIVGGQKALLGHIAIITTTPIAVSGARQFGVGGNSNGGGGGSGSIGSSGAMGQVVTNVTLVDCIYAVAKPRTVIKEVAAKKGNQ